jgi:hypothetical protein
VFVRSAAQLDRARAAVKEAGIAFKILDEHVETTNGHVIEAVKATFPVLLFLASQFAVEKIPQEVAASGESKSELLRVADAFRRNGRKIRNGFRMTTSSSSASPK